LKDGEEEHGDAEDARNRDGGVDDEPMPEVDHDSKEKDGEGQFEDHQGNDVKHFCNCKELCEAEVSSCMIDGTDILTLTLMRRSLYETISWVLVTRVDISITAVQ
jgi:hypothetical protein